MASVSVYEVTPAVFSMFSINDEWVYIIEKMQKVFRGHFNGSECPAVSFSYHSHNEILWGAEVDGRNSGANFVFIGSQNGYHGDFEISKAKLDAHNISPATFGL